MSKDKLSPRVYTDVPRYNGEGTFYATLQIRFYGNEMERIAAEKSIIGYFSKLFKQEVYFDKTIQCFCIYDSANDSCIYKKTTFDLIRDIVNQNWRNKETLKGDVAMLARVENTLLRLDRYKTLHPLDYAIMVERFRLLNLPLYRTYADKYLQNEHTPH
jgi:hypothetical protein